MDFSPLPIYNETRIPSIQSCGIGIPLQLVTMKSYTACSIFLLPVCNISTGVPSSPGAFLVLIWFTACSTSSSVGSLFRWCRVSNWGILSITMSLTDNGLWNRSLKCSFQRSMILFGSFMRVMLSFDFKGVTSKESGPKAWFSRLYSVLASFVSDAFWTSLDMFYHHLFFIRFNSLSLWKVLFTSLYVFIVVWFWFWWPWFSRLL